MTACSNHRVFAVANVKGGVGKATYRTQPHPAVQPLDHCREQRRRRARRDLSRDGVGLHAAAIDRGWYVSAEPAGVWHSRADYQQLSPVYADRQASAVTCVESITERTIHRELPTTLAFAAMIKSTTSTIRLESRWSQSRRKRIWQ